MFIATYTDGYNEVEIDLNGADALPTTKAGKQAVLRYHHIQDLNGEKGWDLISRVMTQSQVKQIKAAGKWISDNDQYWVARSRSTAAILLSDEELQAYIAG
jgi:hypothetical protein